jgi:hypothetical protein
MFMNMILNKDDNHNHYDSLCLAKLLNKYQEVLIKYSSKVYVISSRFLYFLMALSHFSTYGST